MQIALTYLMIQLFTNSAFATQEIAIFQLSLTESGDYLDESECLKYNQGAKKTWRWRKEESECQYESKLTVEKLPFRVRLGSFTVSVDAKRNANVSYSYGDADASTEVGFWLPIKTSDYPPINFSGGEHASGAWHAKGSILTEIP